MILGIVGSPRKGHLTDQLVTRALEGSRSMGAETKKIYLVDFEIKFYMEERKGCPEELSELCEEADAIILGAPVYYGDINGLTKDFMDTVRISNANGKYALEQRSLEEPAKVYARPSNPSTISFTIGKSEV